MQNVHRKNQILEKFLCFSPNCRLTGGRRTEEVPLPFSSFAYTHCVHTPASHTMAIDAVPVRPLLCPRVQGSISGQAGAESEVRRQLGGTYLYHGGVIWQQLLKMELLPCQKQHSSTLIPRPHEGEPCGQSFPTGRKPSGAWGLGLVPVPALQCSVAALLGGHSHEQGDADQHGHNSICLLPVCFCIKNLFLKLYFSSRIFFNRPKSLLSI